MTRKKVYALVLCLALLIAAVLPGTLAVSNDTADSTGSFTLEDQQPVEETPTEEEPPAEDLPVDPETPAEDPAETPSEDPSETPDETPADQPAPSHIDTCYDGCTDEACLCPCHTANAQEPTDFNALYDQLMAAQTADEFNALLGALTEEEAENFRLWLTENGLLEALEAHMDELETVSEPEEALVDWIPAVNMTDVAPLLPPVSGRTVRRAPSRVSTYANENTGSDAEGMHLSKTATANGDGTYKITLEAYATGESVITTVEEDIPTDIVLVLDQSGSMADCISCGLDSQYWSNNLCNKYTEVGTAGTITPSSNTNYYYRNGNSYDQAYYCDGSAWGHSGHNGWYSSSWYHPNSNKLSSDKTLYVSSGHQSRLDALKSAADTFVDAVAKKAAGKDGDIATTDDNVNHRIAVVGFASESGNGNNTELLSISGRNSGNVGVRYGNINDQDLKDVVQSMDTAAGVNMVNSAINALAASGATEIDLGMDMANRILNANPVSAGEKRNRVVVVFTDGAPTAQNGFHRDVAERAISTANMIKNGGTTVYSVGVFSGADASSAGEKPDRDYYVDNWGGTNYTDAEMSAACNWFMQNVSSNNGTPKSPSYYLSAGDSMSLNSIFQQISSNIETGGTSSKLTETAVVKDIISPQFTLPAGATAADITLETYLCTGKDGSVYTWLNNDSTMGAKAAVGADGVVSVTGFNFSENYVGTITEDGNVTYRGHKLVISFTVQPKAGFLGGNDVFTNTNAGVYTDGNAESPLLTFEKPTVNVPIPDVAVTAEDKNVYLKGEVTAEQLEDGVKVRVGTGVSAVALDLSKANDKDKPYGLEPWQTEYVNITVTVKDEDGNEISGNLDKLTDDKTYTVTVTVSPITAGTQSEGTPATAKNGEAEGKINVFKPELTFKDSTAYYGDTAPDFEKNLDKTEWKHNGTLSTKVTMIGTEPTLGLTYTPDTGKIGSDNKINTKTDFEVDVTVKIGTDDVTDETTFVHTKCEGNATCTDPANGKFWVHVKTCTLNISKTGGAVDESYVFDVYKDGEKYSEVTIWGNTTQTLVELPVGNYTIKENTGWSWRYTANNGNGAVLSAENHEGQITCTNAKTIHTWLNGFSTVVRNIFGQKH